MSTETSTGTQTITCRICRGQGRSSRGSSRRMMVCPICNGTGTQSAPKETDEADAE